MESPKQLIDQQPQQQDTQPSLIDQIVQEMGVGGSDGEERSKARRGIEALFAELLRPGRTVDRVDQRLVNDMITTIDRKISAQVDEILHHPEVQKRESAWRGLKMLVDRTDFRENTRIEIVHASKDDLLDDFRDAPEISKSGLYKLAYTAEYGTFGGEPYGAIIGNYEVSPSAPDIEFLQRVASVATMAHSPFIAAASPKFFGEKDFLSLPNLKDIKALMQGPQFIKWNSFRESEDARSVGLTMPRFLLRLPYNPESNPCKSFDYSEDVSGSHEDFLWGNAAFAFATRLTDSFAKYRWCPNIIGPAGGGAVEDLPVHTFDELNEYKIPTEILVSDRKEFELAEEGFIPLTMRKGSDNACFFSANSCQRPKTFGQSEKGKEAEANYKLGTQLPYTFIVSRLAHYIKVLQREQLGTFKERADLEAQLQDWIKQYVADYEAQPEVRARRPLRQAQITVSDVEGDPGWYRVDLKIRPHFKFMGAFFTLSLVGKLDVNK
jgi:type VI secretion system protein ImpC